MKKLLKRLLGIVLVLAIVAAIGVAYNIPWYYLPVILVLVIMGISASFWVVLFILWLLE